MNCEYVKANMADLIGDTVSQAELPGMLQHISQCPECAQDFEMMKQLASNLSPRTEIQASPHLNSVLMKQLDHMGEQSPAKIRNSTLFFRQRWVKVTGIAAALIIAFGLITLFRPQALNSKASAARVLLDKSFAAFGDVKSIFMQFKVRSVPGDNLDIIETRGEFIDYSLWKVFTPVEKWKIQKPGLTVAMDGTHQYKYMEKSGEGYMGSPKTRFVEWMKTLLDPQMIIANEKEAAGKQKNEYAISHTSDETILTVNSTAKGDFSNTYLLNASINESNNRRVYHFDKETNRLTAVEIYILDKGKEIKVLDVVNIDYDIEIPASTFVIQLPEGTKWVEIADLEPKPGKASDFKSADEAAKAFFDAFASQDWKTVFALCPYLESSSKLDNIKDFYGGLTVLSIGKSFKSGLFPGVFVPYEIRLRSGEILKHNLAVRNDNKAKIWTIDGGF